MIDPRTEQAIHSFLKRISGEAEVVDTVLFGSRARHDHRPDSDADLAVRLRGKHGRRTEAALMFADNDLDGACNRACYAMFDAAHASAFVAAVRHHLSPSE